MVRQNVTFQTRGTTRDDTGQLSTTYTDIYAVGAMVKRLSGSETSTQDREVAAIQVELQIPYSTRSIALTTNNRVMIEGKPFDIDMVDQHSHWRKRVVVFATARNQ